MPNASSRSFLGVAPEVTKGTPVAASSYIPVTTLDPSDKIAYLDDKGLRSSMASLFNKVPGPTYSEVSLAGDLFADNVGFPLYGLFGSIATTGASAPFTHTISLNNAGQGQGKPYTLTDYNGLTARQFAAGTFSDFSMKFSADGLVTWSSKVCANLSVTTSTPSPSFSTQPPLASWIGSVTIAGNPIAYVESGEVNCKRNVDYIHTSDGTQNPYQIFQGPISVDGKLTVVAEDETELTRYLSNTQPSLVVNFSQGSAASLVQVQFTVTKAAYTAADVKRGKDYLEYDINWEGIASSTDAGSTGGLSPIKWVIKNANASGAYGT